MQTNSKIQQKRVVANRAQHISYSPSINKHIKCVCELVKIKLDFQPIATKRERK